MKRQYQARPRLRLKGFLLVGTAAAQDTAPEEAGAQGASDIVVTGSRVARRDYDSPSPITTLNAAAIEATGDVTLEEALSMKPAVRPGRKRHLDRLWINRAGHAQLARAGFVPQPGAA